jgi:hypothetical protein
MILLLVRTTHPYAAGLTVAGLGVAAWLVYSFANGASHFGDTQSYLAFADALQAGRLPSSERTPGYPLFLVACRLFAAGTGIVPDVVATSVQVLLLAGICTLLVYDLAYRLTGSVAAASIAAALYVADADVQSFSGAILSDALATAIAIGMIWLAVRFGWRLAGWVCALLVMTRPAYLLIPVVFAAIEAWRARRWTAGLAPLLPTMVLAAVWGVASTVAGARPLMPFATFGPLHSFAKVYEFDLWQALPDSPERRLIAEERRSGHDVYQAASRLAAERGATAMYDVTGQALRAAPSGFVLALARALPRAFRQPSLWRPTHAHPAVFGAVVGWHGFYRAVFYWPPALFGVFLVLLMAATWNGIGWRGATPEFRAVITPFIGERFLSTALLAMGTDQVGRLAMAFRPFYDVVLGLAGVRLFLFLRNVAVRGHPPTSTAETAGASTVVP